MVGTRKGARPATFFASPQKFRVWLEANHTAHKELWVGFYKRDSKRPSITWPESVDEALCFGWIDGIRQSIDVESYRIRFTPRKPGSIWSAINLSRVEALQAAGKMRAAGLEAHAAQTAGKSRVYAYENCDVALPPEFEKQLRANKAASKYFDAQAPSYRKGARRWVLSAKQEATRQSRLRKLIECSAAAEFIPPFPWSLQAPNRHAKSKRKTGAKAKKRTKILRSLR